MKKKERNEKEKKKRKCEWTCGLKVKSILSFDVWWCGGIDSLDFFHI